MLIPQAALGQHIAILGKTGSGKTFAAKAAIVEPLLEQNKRVGIVDPTGAWWGLRSSHDGKSPGFPILVLGGDHGDLPLPALGGTAVARLLAEQNVNLIADTSQLTVGERTRWFIDFGREVYRLNRAPLHLIIDEAHTFAPQGKVPDPDTGKMLHAANQLASGGRSRGIRLTMITQRPQKLHKDTLTCADTLIAMRVLAPHDRLAVEEWIKGCGDMAQGKEVLNSLASLKRGEGWVWYPEGGFLKRLTFPQIKTFDSSATPTDGHGLARPKHMADIDLTEIKATMADAVKEAEANDPKLLRAEIARLKAEAHKRVPQLADMRTVEDAELRGRIEGLANAKTRLRQAGDAISEINKTLSAAARVIQEALARFAMLQLDLYNTAEQVPTPKRSVQASRTNIQAMRIPAQNSASNSVGKSGLRRMLIALAQRPQGLNRRQLGLRAGLSSRSGTFDTYLSQARTRGLVNGSGDRIKITDNGLSALGAFDPLPEGPALLDYWLRQLGQSGAARLLRAVADAYPSELSRSDLAEAAKLSDRSGTFDTYLSRLRGLELITGKREIRASEELFQ